MKRAALVGLVVVAAIGACSSPEYKFAAPDAGGTTTSSTSSSSSSASSSSSSSSGAIADAGYDAQPADFAPIAVANSGNFQADCSGFVDTAHSAAQPEPVQDSNGKEHCFIFFFNQPWGRRWVDAQFACTQITHNGKAAHLATFSDQKLATNMGAVFTPTLKAWIGLQSAGDATQKGSFQWVDQSPFVYDGWAAGHPAGGACVNWAGNDQWIDADCTADKGFLCEFEL